MHLCMFHINGGLCQATAAMSRLQIYDCCHFSVRSPSPLAMAMAAMCYTLPPLFRLWTKHELVLAAEVPDRHSIHPAHGTIHYTRSLRLQARIVIQLPDVFNSTEYAAWISKVPSSWLQGDIVEVYMIAVQSWMAQRPTLAPQDVSMFIQAHRKPPLHCITFLMPM